jgi:DNA-binding NtrC family response regulator
MSHFDRLPSALFGYESYPGGNKRQAARLLNLSRTTFIDKLQRLNVDNSLAQSA